MTMRLTIVNACYPPENVVAGRMAFDLASHLVGAGHEVRVVCPYPSRPMGADYAEFRERRGVATRLEQGVTVMRVPSFTAPQSELLARMRESWSFGRWAAQVLSDPAWRPAVVYEDSWPMLAQTRIARKTLELGIPRVSQIMDLYPESALGKVPRWLGRVMGGPLLRLDRRYAMGAAKVLVVSENMRLAYEQIRGVPADRLAVIHTWQDEAPFRELPRREEAAQRYGVRSDGFTFLYLGNIGAVAGVEHLVRSFAEAEPGRRATCDCWGGISEGSVPSAGQAVPGKDYLSVRPRCPERPAPAVAGGCVPAAGQARGGVFVDTVQAVGLHALRSAGSCVGGRGERDGTIDRPGWLWLGGGAGGQHRACGQDAGIEQTARCGLIGLGRPGASLCPGASEQEPGGPEAGGDTVGGGGAGGQGVASRGGGGLRRVAVPGGVWRKMRVAIVTSEYPPEPTVSGRMAAELASNLAAKGHLVKVICPFPTRPYGVHFSGYDNRRLCREQSGGVEIVRVPSRVAPESRFISRMLESWSFGRWSVRMLCEGGVVPAVVYSSSWPMLGQGWVAAGAARAGIPHVMHIMDVYPEAALQKVGKWMQVLTGRMLLALDRWNAMQATRVVVISENMRETYLRTRGVPSGRLALLHTWQDDGLFAELPDRAEAARIYGVDPDRFTLLYLGNIGPVAGVEHLIRSFSAAGLSGSQLVIVGDGTQKESCVRLARDSSARVEFVSDHAVGNVPLLQSLADVCLLPVKRGAALYSIPSKLGSYMLSAKPVLASVDAESETARVIQAADCGWVVAPEESQPLVEAMRKLREAEAAGLRARGERGRVYALEHLSKTRGLARLAAIVLEASGQQTASELVSERVH